MASDTAETKLREVAQRPARGSLKNFFGDLRDLLRYETLKATVKEFMRDDALGLGAQLAFYLILAIFPFILFCVAILDAFSSSDPQFVTELFDYLRRLLPAQVFDLIQTYTENTLRNEDTAPGLLSVGILGTIWAASGAFAALMNALNRAYDVQETRPFWKVRG
nr:YihY/virulence factor BrkB family protein [Actinomycetota bacterium]